MNLQSPRVLEVEPACFGSHRGLEIFTVVSDAPSPSSSLVKHADAFREEVQVKLDSIPGTQGGAVVKTCASEGGLCAQKSSCLQTSPGCRSAPSQFIFQRRHQWSGGGVGLSGRNRKGRIHLAVSPKSATFGSHSPARPPTPLSTHALGWIW